MTEGEIKIVCKDCGSKRLRFTGSLPLTSEGIKLHFFTCEGCKQTYAITQTLTDKDKKKLKEALILA